MEPPLVSASVEGGFPDAVRGRSGRRYRIGTRPIGAGGQAEVWPASRDDGVPVAIKFARAGRAAADALGAEARWLAALEREGVASAIVCLDRLEWEGRPGLVLPRFPRDLDAFVDLRVERASGRKLEVVLAVGVQVARALDALHRARFQAGGRVGVLVHRDVKPANILVDAAGSLRLADLGGSVLADGSVRPLGVFGSPLWAPVDQMLPGLLEPNTTWDTYAVCVMLHTWIAGERPSFQTDPLPRLTPRGAEILARLRELAGVDSSARSDAVDALFAAREGSTFEDVVASHAVPTLPFEDRCELVRGVTAAVNAAEYGDEALELTVEGLEATLARGMSPRFEAPHRYRRAGELADELAALLRRLGAARRRRVLATGLPRGVPPIATRPPVRPPSPPPRPSIAAAAERALTRVEAGGYGASGVPGGVRLARDGLAASVRASGPGGRARRGGRRDETPSVGGAPPGRRPARGGSSRPRRVRDEAPVALPVGSPLVGRLWNIAAALGLAALAGGLAVGGIALSGTAVDPAEEAAERRAGDATGAASDAPASAEPADPTRRALAITDQAAEVRAHARVGSVRVAGAKGRDPAFRVGRTEVTNADYAVCVAAGSCTPLTWTADDAVFRGLAGDRQPVVGVTWDQANAWCRWVGGRLPTEAEWERAAIGSPSGRARRWPWGAAPPDCTRANLAGCGLGGTAPVEGFALGASAWGAVQMLGNAWEWTAARGPAGTGRVLRGGAYDSVGIDLVDIRAVDSGGAVSPTYTFRCVYPDE